MLWTRAQKHGDNDKTLSHVVPFVSRHFPKDPASFIVCSSPKHLGREMPPASPTSPTLSSPVVWLGDLSAINDVYISVLDTHVSLCRLWEKLRYGANHAKRNG